MAKWLDVCPVSDLPAGQRRCATVEGRPIVVFNIAGRLFAAANHCPHAGMPLEDGELNGSVLTCPFHGYTFRLADGKNVDYPDDSPLPTYPTRLDGGNIQVQMPDGDETGG